MANSIATAKRYYNNDEELAKIYSSQSYTGDWQKENKAVGAKTVAYRQVSLGSTVLGTFNRATGYTKKDITVTWVEKTLSQDKGDSLVLDKMDGEEAQFLEIGTVANKYIRDVQIPAVDTYRFTQVVGTTGVRTVTATSALSKTDIEAAIDAGLDYLYGIGVREGVTLKISATAYRALSNAAKDSGSVSLGAWNGDLSAQVLTYGDIVKAKITVVPNDIIGSGVNFILAPTAAIAAMVKYQENEYFDKIPGFGGRRAQMDIGIYHDCWVEPGAEKAVYVHKTVSQSAS